MAKAKFLTAYSDKRRIQITFSTKGRTKQSFKDETDINNIIRRFMRIGVMDFTNKNQGRYGDTTGIEYQQAVNTVAAAKSLFNELPAELRARFENEPARFLDFVQDERNRDEARELGLLKPEAVAEVREATPPASPPGKTQHEASEADVEAPGGRSAKPTTRKTNNPT